jgi:hypothetical protein
MSKTKKLAKGVGEFKTEQEALEFFEVAKKKWFQENGDKIETSKPIVHPIEYGWVCPKCGAVYAPMVRQCFCTGNKVTC